MWSWTFLRWKSQKQSKLLDWNCVNFYFSKLAQCMFKRCHHFQPFSIWNLSVLTNFWEWFALLRWSIRNLQATWTWCVDFVRFLGPQDCHLLGWILGGLLFDLFHYKTSKLLPSLKLTAFRKRPWKMDGTGRRLFPFGAFGPIFRCYVSLREGICKCWRLKFGNFLQKMSCRGFSWVFFSGLECFGELEGGMPVEIGNPLTGNPVPVRQLSPG